MENNWNQQEGGDLVVVAGEGGQVLADSVTVKKDGNVYVSARHGAADVRNAHVSKGASLTVISNATPEEYEKAKEKFRKMKEKIRERQDH